MEMFLIILNTSLALLSYYRMFSADVPHLKYLWALSTFLNSMAVTFWVLRLGGIV